MKNTRFSLSGFLCFPRSTIYLARNVNIGENWCWNVLDWFPGNCSPKIGSLIFGVSKRIYPGPQDSESLVPWIRILNKTLKQINSLLCKKYFFIEI